MASDADLNEYVSLKKLAPYRKPKFGKAKREEWDGGKRGEAEGL